MSVAAQLFSGLSRDVRSGSSPGSGWATQGHCIGCVLRAIVLLEYEPSPQSEVLTILEQVFMKDFFVLCSVHLSLDPYKSPSPCRCPVKTSPQHDAANTMLHWRDGARFNPDVTLGIQAKEFKS